MALTTASDNTKVFFGVRNVEKVFFLTCWELSGRTLCRWRSDPKTLSAFGSDRRPTLNLDGRLSGYRAHLVNRKHTRSSPGPATSKSKLHRLCMPLPSLPPHPRNTLLPLCRFKQKSQTYTCVQTHRCQRQKRISLFLSFLFIHSSLKGKESPIPRPIPKLTRQEINRIS